MKSFWQVHYESSSYPTTTWGCLSCMSRIKTNLACNMHPVDVVIILGWLRCAYSYMYKSVVGNRRLKWCEIGAKERSRIEESRMSEEAPRSLVSPRHGVYAHRLLHKASLVGAVRKQIWTWLLTFLYFAYIKFSKPVFSGSINIPVKFSSVFTVLLLNNKSKTLAPL